jgi:hypothetical protein
MMKRLLLLATIAACAPAHAPAPPATRAPIDPEAAQRDALAALAAGRYDDALASLAPLTDDDAAYATRVVYFRATALLYERDFAGATKLFQARVDVERARADRVKEAWLHNAITWVRWAAGDHAGALAENELVARAVADPAVSADDRHGAMLHYWWDRAYLLAEDPASRPQADDARKAYVELAEPKAEHDGLAVLAAFFAVIDHDGATALAQARQVDAAKDDDLQDLYVLALAHDAGGDRAGADALRAMIRKGSEYPMKPIILQRLTP